MRKLRKLTEADFVFTEENLTAYLARIREQAVMMSARMPIKEIIDDIVQEIALRSIRNQSFYNKPRFAILSVLNKFWGKRDKVTGRRVKQMAPVDINSPNIRKKLSAPSKPDLVIGLTGALRTLTPEQLELFELYYLEGLTLEDIGMKYGITQQGANHRLKRLHEALGA